MFDIRGLISGKLHVERVVFSSDNAHARHEPEYHLEMRTHHYIGALSGDRFLLLEIPSPESAKDLVDLRTIPLGTILARTLDTDFAHCGPLIAPKPRAEATAEFERGLGMLLHPLRACLQLGVAGIAPGSVRWDGDNFRAEYSDEIKNSARNISVSFGPPGVEISESEKEKRLARCLNPPPKNPTSKVVVKQARISVSRGERLEALPKPAPGSAEARLLAHHMAKHDERMAQGVTGQLLRNAQGNVAEIHYHAGVAQRVELEYAPSENLPLPFPHRINKCARPEAVPAMPASQITIYSLRVSERPLDDSVFVLWNYLKESSYVRGQALPGGRFRLVDPKDYKLERELTEIQDRAWDQIKRQTGP